MTDSFYVPLGDDCWRATVHTTGPWDARAQHGGPPSALLGRAIQRCSPRDDMIVARFTGELLGPVPVGELRVRARVVRPGRRVELVEAAADVDGRDVVRATAWRVLRADGEVVASIGAVATAARGQHAGQDAGPPDLPDASMPTPPDGWVDGYLSAVEWRLVRGTFVAPGPAAVWTRLRYPLVPDEEPGPLERVLSIADSGSGVSGELDIGRWQFINPELTVHLHREAVGEWICLDAQTTISPGGAGLATSVLSDSDGPVGIAAQSLLVTQRASTS